MNRKIALALVPCAILLALGIINIVRKVAWEEPTDGVIWAQTPNGIMAVKVETRGPGDLYGVKKGDFLYKINDTLIRTRIDVVKSLWANASSGRKMIYEISHEGELRHPSFFPERKSTGLAYYYLILVGLTAFVIGLIIFLNTKKPLSTPNVFFLLLSMSLFAAFTFSSTGEFDLFDSVFYWLNAAAFLVFPPLLFHYFAIFPQRLRALKKRPRLAYAFYAPAGLILTAKLFLFLPLSRGLDDAQVLSIYGWLKKLDLFNFFVFLMAVLAAVEVSRARAASVLIKKQFTWIRYGLGMGALPFAVLYGLPFVLGQVPGRFSELSILFLALLPLTLAYSLSRYKLMDFEVLLKKAATLAISYFVIATLYLVVSSQTRIFSENRLNAVILGVLAIILGATLFGPLRKLFGSLLDRVFYKRSYKYRKTLLIISQELSRERNLQKLSQKLLELVANALSLRDIALLLPEGRDGHHFIVLGARGEFLALPRRIPLDEKLVETFRAHDYLTHYQLAEHRDLREALDRMAGFGFVQFMPLKVEGKLIGLLGMGRKLDTTFLNIEDWELLTTIGYPVALALENAALYDQASDRALELERLKDYSENIIESLTVGVAVLDQRGRIMGWNRVLEETFFKKKDEVLGRGLGEVLGEANQSAIFPSETQSDYRLLSEIQIQVALGQNRIFDIAKTPLLDNRLNPYGTIIVFEDITDKILMQHQLMTSEKLASIGLLSAGVAHEINTPLTGISSYVQLLQKKLVDTHYAQILGKIEAQTDRVARIIKNLLNFARSPSEISFSRVNVTDGLKEILALIDYKLKAMNIVLELKAPNIRPIWAQGERLQQVFINIILNALDAMPHGGTLRLDVQEEDEFVAVRITDTGTGIKKQHLPHIFDPFFTTKGVGKGTGLGLSISYAIIKEHEGRILVDSVEGQGTTFTVLLPKDLDLRRLSGLASKTPPGPSSDQD
jgi:two-component system NtrC family sensor kinase